ncbi:family 16 glycosylhydrolase [Streptomyces sp. TRM66268-LWL]|uniref:Family 16 glycosylhydrolase n=1 Tax=Streptomyces polyasparticus TaxID=2767826 RepID=A0ABR7S8B9_9ACTN|nr:cellulose binding domain-containing protein [Streptomyces polyasparticus]MBC9711025.1 family 16 glycosylhydrolase [Streptomyces polyasparticus]
MASTRRRRPRGRSRIARAFKVLLAVAVIAGAALAAKPLYNHFNPDEPDLTVRYRTETKAESDAARPWLEVLNTSDKPLPLSEVKLRYYFTAEDDASYAFNCVEAHIGCSNLSGTIVTMDKPSEKADHYLELGFSDKSGTVAPGGNSKGLELQLFRTDHKPLQQDDDWSFDAAKTAYTESEQIAAYRQGELAWGKEPDGGTGRTAAGGFTELPQGAVFDNFNYQGPKDTALFKHNWLVRSSEGGPGIEDTWQPEGISFPGAKDAIDGQVLNLRAATDGTKAGTSQSAIGTRNGTFRTGTYAARIKFSDKPAAGKNGDPIQQTFFTIGGKGAKYSELDFEYMPNGGWGAVGPRLTTTTWRNDNLDDIGARVTREHDQRLGGWHTMLIVVDEDGVTYSMDGKTLYRSKKAYVPRSDMHINFNTWFVDLDKPLSGERAWDMQIDWVYQVAGQTLTAEEAEQAAKSFQEGGVGYFDTSKSD